jgi:rod shape determining protein RodA
MVELHQRNFRDIDWVLLLAPIALIALGCVGIHSTAPGPELRKQLIALGIGLVLAVAIMLTDYRKILLNVAPFLYGAVMVLLVLVLVFGRTINGNRAWLQLPGFSLQPSEFAKIATILMMARFFAHPRGELRLKDMVLLFLTAAPPLILIELEHDTGTMLTFGAILGAYLFLGGMRKLLLVVALVGLFSGLIAVYPHLKGYQKQRIMAVLEPEKVDPRGYAYQTIQSVVAVGSGGLLGKGIGNGTQGRLGFLPFAWTDFIGAVIAEEMGLVGVLLMMLLYLALIWRLIVVAQGSRDRAGALMVMGLVCLISFHILCNLGMVVGLMPIMGIPLPLMSSGGTSVISMFAGIGLALSVRLRRFVN